jgi:thiol-disulfide isomerase/thioredoxin
VQVPFLADELRSRYKFQLALLMKNRVGEKATNFTYTVASGLSNTLFNLKSEFTLVIFSNPGCSTCEAVISRLNQSKELNEALSLNSRSRTMLAILTLYPDDDLEEWKAHLPSMPERWIHAYDKEKAVIQQNLYDIKAYPTLYLLDKEKNVLLKDSSIEAIESFFSVSR